MRDIDLSNPDLFVNRELSLLEFNRRVLEQAKDDATPLLERLRFLCISSRNLDEFFEVRAASVKQQIDLGVLTSGPDGLTPHEQLARISAIAHELVAEQYRVLNDVLLPLMADQGIRVLKRSQWDGRLTGWVKRHFDNEVQPVLTPIGLDLAHPFPRVLNKSLNFIIALEGKDVFGRDSGLAVLQAPRSLPRVIEVPKSYSGDTCGLVFLSSIIHAHVEELFPGMRVTGCHQFRVTRNSDLFVDEEAVDDLLRALQGELPGRRYGDGVRLEVADNCPRHLARFLLEKFELTEDDLYQVNGPVNLNRLMAIPDMVDRPDLKFPPFTPSRPARLAHKQNMFEALADGDLLLHHPYEAFSPVQDLVRQAAVDPAVLAIKQTIYRTDTDSTLVGALIDAARAGKEVTAVVELRARFDEEANIGLATRLQEAGAHVVYGVVGYKTHAKLLMIVRREGRKLRRYVHLGTGNYHASTARLYTDYGLLTCDKAIGEDVHKLFQQLTGLGRITRLKKLLQSPFTLHQRMVEMIEREAEAAKAGRPARVLARMNSLVEPQIIRAMYRASQAGVKIDLLVRGICCLRTGLPGVSDNIRVRSVVGRFLEHSRVFCFHNDGDPQVYCSSADWMDRNFFRRVESAFPVEDPALRKRVIDESLELYLADNVQAWEQLSDGGYRRLEPGRRKATSAQATLLERLAEQVH
ncbi:MAG: polyphosphate kinase 1 [Gammaproteobacteria bacterium]|nr:polyphosphate kinase 1 [Gammaproteobacteria bacterium]